MSRIREQFGRIDALFVNAGVADVDVNEIVIRPTAQV